MDFHPQLPECTLQPSDEEIPTADQEVGSQLSSPAEPSSPEPPQPAGQPARDGGGEDLSYGAQLLPAGWRATLPEEQQDWVGRALFTKDTSGQTTLTSNLNLWWYPPGEKSSYTQPPSAHDFFQVPFFLWAPSRYWACQLVCPSCGCDLTDAGLYRSVRRVLDVSWWYFMGTEYLECLPCCKKYTAWSGDILVQMPLAYQEQFPAVLTYKLSCDKKVVRLLNGRTLGDSPNCLRVYLLEQHSEQWHLCKMGYLSVLKKLGVPGVEEGRVDVPPLHPIPRVTWLLAVCVREALPHLQEKKARITSTFGDILKMDSSKKLTEKLAGEATWVTNVGNEHGQVLMSVLTASEGAGLSPMAAGLMRRYREAGKTPPTVMYVDRDCCSTSGKCKISAMFSEWDHMFVRLDAYHLMQRFARGVTKNDHWLYSAFMGGLSLALYEWDQADLDRLWEAKRMVADRYSHVSLSAKELARHCRRRVRVAEEAERLIQELLDQYSEVTNTMGVKLINQTLMEEIWRTQRCHLHCIQDPPGLKLYTKTREITKGGVRLPVFRSARGSSSLDSFHLHLCRFIPGKSSNSLDFQVHLLERLMRWNENRAAVGMKPNFVSFNTEMLRLVKQLAQQYLDDTVLEAFNLPGEYTGELIGLEYLYSQTGQVLDEAFQGDPDVPDGMEEEEDDNNGDDSDNAAGADYDLESDLPFNALELNRREAAQRYNAQ